ncbi:MAG: OmpH family outer membrane protein [Williamsia sp.]|nr:OmpH family outer membrane protein [Williamsia sp.]
MKQLLIALNIVLLILVAVLFYLHFDTKNKTAKTAASGQQTVPSAAPSMRIAYFEMDSVQANYEYFKDIIGQLKKKENAMNAELAGLEKSYQQKVSMWQQKGKNMTEIEMNAAQKENAQMQQNYQLRKQTLEEGYTRESIEYKKNIKEKIEEYLQDYNKDKNYTYILSYEPEFIYYRDTTMNITKELVTGLNAAYKKK